MNKFHKLRLRAKHWENLHIGKKAQTNRPDANKDKDFPDYPKKLHFPIPILLFASPIFHDHDHHPKYEVESVYLLAPQTHSTTNQNLFVPINSRWLPHF